MNISDQEKKILQKKHKDFATWKAFTILEGWTPIAENFV